MAMDHDVFRAWLCEIDDVSADRRGELEAFLAERSPSAAVIAESRSDERRCPHCGCEGAVARGKAAGLRRFWCKGCVKTFNALTGTPLARLRMKARWLGFARSLSEGETWPPAPSGAGSRGSTALRWRRRFLRSAKGAARTLRGIVEADET